MSSISSSGSAEIIQGPHHIQGPSVGNTSSNLANPGSIVSSSTNANSILLARKNNLKKLFDKKFVGFKFSTPDQEQSILGLLYQSRVPLVESPTPLEHTDAPQDVISLDVAENMSSSQSNASEDSDEEEEAHIESQHLNPRQQLALTVKNWTKTPENDKNLLVEGAVQALIALTSTDDVMTKKWCGVALYNLSTRPESRSRLLELGAARGMIAVVTNARNWKAIKLCAMTLCNLSIEPGGEETLLSEHAHLSLVSFMSARGHYLLPICTQALYNLTQVSRYSSTLERVIKALLNVPVRKNFHSLLYITYCILNYLPH